MPARKIDFAALRKQLSFANVLAHYRVQGKAKGSEQWQGYCPLPAHVQKGDGGKPRSPSFSVNLTRGIYQCFGCGGKGNVLELVIRMERFDPEIGEQFRAGALRANDIFFADPPADVKKVTPAQPPAAPTADTAHHEQSTLPIVVNATLDFALQGLDPAHPYLAERGFTAETIAHFGIGYTNRGLMKNRIAIPLKNDEGALIGYAGRLVDDNLVDEQNPKYRFPGDREREGKTFIFKKSELLYYPEEIRRLKSKYLFLVEGFPSVWWLWQHGIRPVVAVMGASLSEYQVERVLRLTTADARIVIIPDGDAAGERLADSALKLLSPHRYVRWHRLPDGMQPTDPSVLDGIRHVLQLQ